MPDVLESESMRAGRRFRFERWSVVALILLGVAALARAQEKAHGSYFPLDLRRHWRYQLTLEVDGTQKKAFRDRTNVSATKLGERDAVVVEEKLENNLTLTETYAQDGDAILLLASRAEGGAEHVLDPPRPMILLSRLDTVGAVWTWTSTDGRESWVTTVTTKGIDKEGREEVILVAKGTQRSRDSLKTATQEKTITLVRGVGMTREEDLIVPPDEQHKTKMTSELRSHDRTDAPK